ncbi:MAG: ATP-grasp domain-containing protein [Planctomycetota bacterium]
MQIDTGFEFDFLSELYELDAPGACLLAEYPSSNSDETIFQNRSRYIIHDPFPPPERILMKVLGPHHLMCSWGNRIDVSSEIGPSQALLDHWQRFFGKDGCPAWEAFSGERDYITIFPHESFPAARQIIEPAMNYEIHSKEVIERIDCPQPEVLKEIAPPCIVKLSHGYAGLGNYFVRSREDADAVGSEVRKHWPGAVLVATEIIEEITRDVGVQFYLRSTGEVIWLGYTQQHFDQNVRWCGGSYSAATQISILEEVRHIVEPVATHLHDRGYFGVVGIDILRNANDEHFLVDVNPRLTGITPFLIASRIFNRAGLSEGVYSASCRFDGKIEQLIADAESAGSDDLEVVVLSAVERDDGTTTCHLSANSNSQDRCLRTLDLLTS